MHLQSDLRTGHECSRQAGEDSAGHFSEYAEQSRPLSGIASAFFPKAAEFNSTPWHLAAGFDFAFPQTRGTRPPGTEERARYLATLDALQADDAKIPHLITEVFHLLRPLSVLQQEPLRSRRVINPAQWQWALINEVGRARRAGRIPLARDLPNACKP